MGINKSDLILLKYLDGFETSMEPPHYFVFEHNLDIENCIKKFLARKLLQISSVEYSLSKLTIAQLKNLLSDFNLKSSGKKQELLDRLLTNVSKEKLTALELKKYYVLTDSGKELVACNLTKDDYDNRYNSLKIPHNEEIFNFIQNYNYKAAEDLIRSDQRNPVVQHSDYKGYNAYMEFTGLWPEKFIPIEKKLKSWLLLCYMVGFRHEDSNRFIYNNVNINLPSSFVTQQLHVIKSMDDFAALFITEKNLAGSGLNVTYTIKSMNDERVCAVCSRMDGKTFTVSEAKLGETFPPFLGCTCELCRCYTSVNIG